LLSGSEPAEAESYTSETQPIEPPFQPDANDFIEISEYKKLYKTSDKAASLYVTNVVFKGHPGHLKEYFLKRTAWNNLVADYKTRFVFPHPDFTLDNIPDDDMQFWEQIFVQGAVISWNSLSVNKKYTRIKTLCEYTLDWKTISTNGAKVEAAIMALANRLGMDQTRDRPITDKTMARFIFENQFATWQKTAYYYQSRIQEWSADTKDAACEAYISDYRKTLQASKEPVKNCSKELGKKYFEDFMNDELNWKECLEYYEVAKENEQTQPIEPLFEPDADDFISYEEYENLEEKNRNAFVQYKDGKFLKKTAWDKLVTDRKNRFVSPRRDFTLDDIPSCDMGFWEREVFGLEMHSAKKLKKICQLTLEWKTLSKNPLKVDDAKKQYANGDGLTFEKNEPYASSNRNELVDLAKKRFDEELFTWEKAAYYYQSCIKSWKKNELNATKEAFKIDYIAKNKKGVKITKGDITTRFNVLLDDKLCWVDCVEYFEINVKDNADLMAKYNLD